MERYKTRHVKTAVIVVRVCRNMRGIFDISDRIQMVSIAYDKRHIRTFFWGIKMRCLNINGTSLENVLVFFLLVAHFLQNMKVF